MVDQDIVDQAFGLDIAFGPAFDLDIGFDPAFDLDTALGLDIDLADSSSQEKWSDPDKKFDLDRMFVLGREWSAGLDSMVDCLDTIVEEL